MWKKIVLGIVLVIVLGITAVLGTLTFRRPTLVPPSNVKVAGTPEQVARGKYLFHAVSVCADCHSVLDMSRFGGPVVEGGLGKGKVMPEEMGLPGTIVASNLTSDKETGVADWTDGELIRAIRDGIGRDRRALFPLMPYSEYRHLSDSDVEAIVAYIRTLPAASNRLPPTKISFPVNLLIQGAPQPAGRIPEPDRSRPEAYGKYLVKVAGCQFCHTPVENEEPIPGKEFSGGHVFPMDKQYSVVSANLTPHEATGTGRWSEQQFLDKFYQYKDYVENGSPQVPLKENTIMPWLNYARMEEADLKAIFAYLKTVPAIENAVETKPGR